MRTILLIILVVLIIIPCSDKAEQLICELVKKVTKDKIPVHKVLPVIKILLSIVMLFMGYSILTKICLIAVVIQNAIILKKY